MCFVYVPDLTRMCLVVAQKMELPGYPESGVDVHVRARKLERGVSDINDDPDAHLRLIYNVLPGDNGDV